MTDEVKPASILIVDDTEANVRLLEHVVKREGYEVFTAYSGEAALKLAEQQRPDIILLDIMMPGIDGFEVCERLKANEELQDIPVVFLSALSEPDSKIKGFQVGGVDYITKPFQRQEVLARIDLHVKVNQLQNQLEDKVRLLEEREKSLQALNAEKDELVRMVSHDFRNPVSGILGVTAILKEKRNELSEEELTEIYDAIEEVSRKLLHLVNELLSKEEKTGLGISELNLQPVNIERLIHEVVNLHRPTAIKKSISLKMACDRVGDLSVDRHKVEQIVSNLLSNALKFTPEEGTISVELTQSPQDDNAVQLKISDTGIGISRDRLSKLWKDARNGVRAGTSGETGSGMGLQIIKNFTELHGGEISVDTAEGEGTTFALVLRDQS